MNKFWLCEKPAVAVRGRERGNISLGEHQRARILKKTSQEEFFTLALIPVKRPGLVATVTGACRGFRARQETLDNFTET
jgi:hypothetical protein